MAGNIKGITIEFRGDTTKLDKAIREINKESKALDKELKQIDKSLEFNPKSITMWKQKQTALTEAIQASKTRLDELNKAKDQLDEKGIDRNTAEYRELEREILKAENQQKRLNAELKKIPTATIRAAGEAMKDLGEKMKNAGKTFTTYVTAPIVAGYTAAAGYASDYEENLNKIDVAFGDSADAVKAWASTARSEFGLSAVQATDAAASFGALGKGIGLTEADAAEMSTTLAGLSADLGSYFNVGTDESSKALEGIFTGESEALKKFGVVMTDTNLQAFAEDQGLVWKEMDQTQKTMLRYQYVLEKTQDAQGDFSRTSDGTANSIKIFKATIQDLATSIGSVLLPIITPIIQKVTEWINKFNELDPRTQKIITVVGLAVAAIGPLLTIIGTLTSAIGSLMIFGPAILSTVGPIIAIIGALVAAGVLLYKNWDVIKAKAIELFNKLKTTFNNIKTSIITTFNNLKAQVTSIWTGIKNAIITPIQNAYNTVRGWIQKLKNLFPLSIGKIFSNLKIPHINVSGGKAPFGIGGLGVKPSISVDWYDKGGIFRSPSIIGVGEKRPEFVGALDDLRDIVREESGGSGITINVYGAEGQSASAIAAEVERRLIAAQKRRRMAWQ